MTITKVRLRRFTAFEDFAFTPTRGVNVLVGANGTGKTHLMKAAYAACDVSKTGNGFADKLLRVFMPSEGAIGRLVKRQRGRSDGSVTISRGERQLRATFSNRDRSARAARIIGVRWWESEPVESVYIPVKEMLANAPGFRSLYAQREIHFEEIYDDIVARAHRPVLRGPADRGRKVLLASLQQAIEGKVAVRNDEFFLQNREGRLEFSLLAEGMRKLGLLWLLIQNGTLLEGSVLFWDEPETNLNPRLFGPVIQILLELQRLGVQVFIATHDYAILKELDLRQSKEDPLAYHALYRDPESGQIACHSVHRFVDIHPNAIAEAFGDLYDREVTRSLGGHAA